MLMTHNPITMKVKKEIKEKDSDHSSILQRIGEVLSAFFGFLGQLLLYLFRFIKNILILIEKSFKVIAIFIITLFASILFLTTSMFLVAKTFDLEKSPAFEVLRDRIGLMYAMHVEQGIRDIEHENEWQFDEGLENMNEELRRNLDIEFRTLLDSMGSEMETEVGEESEGTSE